MVSDISIVIPMYNESEGLKELFLRVTPILEQMTDNWEIICVNDGSKDDSLSQLISFHKSDPRIKIVNFSRNFGKEAALTAGIEHSNGKVVIPLDADLQDPPELIPQMVKKWTEGYKVVLATRSSRREEGWLKRTTANIFYKILGKISSVNIPANTGDYRLMDRQVVEALKSLPERTRFMKGIFAWLGFPTTTIFFERPERFAGKTSWNYWKLWKFALDGILSFTAVPLQIWTYIGAVISLISFLYGSFLVVRTIFFGVDVPGFASIMVCILFLGGVQLLSMGILGEYIGRIYHETKQRPLYIIEEKIGF